jgi:hypothetical protein
MMQRFLILVGVAVVAAAMYVAASPASQQASGPSAKQFNALKKEVATLTKTLKTVKAEANDADGFVQTCLVSSGAGIVPINQFGTTTDGFLFGTPAGSPTPTAATARSALDVDTSATPGALVIAVDPTCVNSKSSLHLAGHSRLSTAHVRAAWSR